MSDDGENEFEYTHKFNVQGQDSEKFRERASKATRASRRPKKPATPGSIRLRRNKHWSW